MADYLFAANGLNGPPWATPTWPPTLIICLEAVGKPLIERFRSILNQRISLRARVFSNSLLTRCSTWGSWTRCAILSSSTEWQIVSK